MDTFPQAIKICTELAAINFDTLSKIAKLTQLHNPLRKFRSTFEGWFLWFDLALHSFRFAFSAVLPSWENSIEEKIMRGEILMLIWRFIKAIFQRLIRGFSLALGNYSGLLKFYCFLIFLSRLHRRPDLGGRNKSSKRKALNSASWRETFPKRN